MTTEQLRTTILADIDRVFNSPKILTLWLSEDSKRLLRSQRSYWQNASADDLNRLLKLYQEEP